MSDHNQRFNRTRARRGDVVAEPELIGDDAYGRTYAHPAYGTIGSYHTSGSAVLVGSDFLHNGFVSLRISRAHHHRGLSTDRFAETGIPLVEVQLSESQWAALVSRPNIGSGTPCTIHRLNGKTMPELPLRDEADAFKAEMPETLRDAVAHLESLKLGGKFTRAQLSLINMAIRDITSSVDFVASRFGEHVEERMEKAKVEIAAYMDAMIAQTGIEALARPIETDPKAIEHEEGDSDV